MEILKPFVIDMLASPLASIGVSDENWQAMISPSREKSLGDLSLPCFAFAKTLKMKPDDIATKIHSMLTQSKEISEINSTGGYLNFKAATNWMATQIISENIRIGDANGRKPSTGKSVLIEHTSANPNGPFHVGRARNAILGDTLVRLHRLHGNDVRAEYYVDDMGKQVAVLAWALEKLSIEDVDKILSDSDEINEKWADKSDHSRVRWYQAAQKLRSSQNDDIEEELSKMVHASENGDVAVLDSFENAYQPVLKGMLETLARLRIFFDEFTKESKFVINGDVDRLMKTLSSLEINGIADNGAEYLDLGQRGLKGKTEFYYKRGDGSSLYATRDIAYHIWKFEQYSNLINVLGEDHKLQSKQVSTTLKELGHPSPEVLFYSFIKLPEGKMSTRKGNVVFMDDLLEEAKAFAAQTVRELRPNYDEELVSNIAEAVGTSAVRFNIIKVSPDKGFTFKWEEALSFDSDSAPFIMYSHTRSCSIESNCLELGLDLSEINPSESDISSTLENCPESLTDLLRTICAHNDSIARSVEQNRPNLFANQLLQLANCYNGFYRDCRIIDDGQVNHVLFLISKFASRLLRSGMEGLGIDPIERM